MGKNLYFEANIYDTKCICVNDTDLDRTERDKINSVGYDLLIKFNYYGKGWYYKVYSVNNTVNVKVFCENRNGRTYIDNVGLIETKFISDFFKDML